MPHDSARVLLVDDENDVRRVLATILSRKGFVVVEATNGREALQKLELDPKIAVVITDLVMPEFEGFETIRACREIAPSIKILAISGAFGGEFLTIAQRLGADLTLPKPIHPDALVDAVQQLAGLKTPQIPPSELRAHLSA